MEKITSFEFYSLRAGRTLPNTTAPLKGAKVAAVLLAINMIEQLGEQIEVIKKHVFHGHDLTPEVTTMINEGMFADPNVRSMTIDPMPALRLNMALGLAGESCEVATKVAALAMGNTEVTPEDIGEETGDALWYANGVVVTHLLDFGEVASKNIFKLMTRYPDGFSEQASQERVV